MAAAGLLLLGANLENHIPKPPSVVLDNARLLMIVLVIATEMISPEFAGFLDVLSLMNPFQTRTLAFISGFVNKTSGKSSKKSWRDVWMKSRNTLAQILIVSFLFEPICYTYTSGQWQTVSLSGYCSEVWKLLLFSGLSIHWYLFGLLWWRLLNFIMSDGHPLLRMAAALMLSQLVKFHEAKWQALSFLSMSESFECFPLFVAGDICRSNWTRIEEYLREELEDASPLSTVFGSRFFQVTFGWALLLYFHVARCIFGGIVTCPSNTECVWAVSQVFRKEPTWSTQVFAQLNWLAGDLMMLGEVVVFLLLLCPRGESFMTKCGRRTLHPFLLHHMLLPALKNQLKSIISYSSGNGLLAWLLLFLFCYVLVFQLTQPMLCKVFDPILQPFGRR